MGELAQSLVLIASLLLLLAAGVWVSLALVASGLVALLLFTDAPAGIIFATKSWDASANWALTALPLFIWMGEILYRTRLAEDMFQRTGPLGAPPAGPPGACQRAGLRDLRRGQRLVRRHRRDHRPHLAAGAQGARLRRRPGHRGSLAGAGTLGLLIPPSIVMIVYGVAAQVSLIKLFIAGILPGLLLMALFSGYIGVWSLRNPARVPPREPAVPWLTMLARLRLLLPVVALIAGVIGSIYARIATATEAATIGAIGALAIAAWGKSLNRRSFIDSLMGATRTSCMISFILLGAAYLTSAMSFTGLPAKPGRVDLVAGPEPVWTDRGADRLLHPDGRLPRWHIHRRADHRRAHTGHPGGGHRPDLVRHLT
ncbi:TRAP dicarboxylate transporter subunit DctM [Bordetella pertussis]|nr:TRAP dicarboxylate transporter subunit DctM [Bordetella pertussis]